MWHETASHIFDARRISNLFFFVVQVAGAPFRGAWLTGFARRPLGAWVGYAVVVEDVASIFAHRYRGAVVEGRCGGVGGGCAESEMNPVSSKKITCCPCAMAGMCLFTKFGTKNEQKEKITVIIAISG